MKKIIIGIILGLMLLGIMPEANASVIYDFTGLSTINGTATASFTLITSTFITSDTIFSAAQFSSYNVSDGSAFNGAEFNPNETNWSPFADAIGLHAGINPDYYFNAGDFSKVGSYDSIILPDQEAHLVVTQTPNATPVPEPGTMMLIGVGMAGLAIYGKRRNSSKA